MKWIEPTVFAKSCGNPDFRSIFGHQRAKNEGTNTKINRGPETNPISINPRDEMNWANSFREKLRKPCLQTDGRTDGQTDGQTSGWIQYTPFPPSVERGYNYGQSETVIVRGPNILFGCSAHSANHISILLVQFHTKILHSSEQHQIIKSNLQKKMESVVSGLIFHWS